MVIWVIEKWSMTKRNQWTRTWYINEKWNNEHIDNEVICLQWNVAHTTSRIMLGGLVTRTLTLEHNCGWKGLTMLVTSDDKNNKFWCGWDVKWLIGK
jgi:hypothetical protein